MKFRWLHKPANAKPKDHMALTTHPDKVLQPSTGSIPHYQSFRPILDGQEVIVQSVDPELRLSWEIVQLQWDLCRMASLCGAAEVDDDDDYDDDDDDEEEEETDVDMAEGEPGS